MSYNIEVLQLLLYSLLLLLLIYIHIYTRISLSHYRRDACTDGRAVSVSLGFIFFFFLCKYARGVGDVGGSTAGGFATRCERAGIKIIIAYLTSVTENLDASFAREYIIIVIKTYI